MGNSNSSDKPLSPTELRTAFAELPPIRVRSNEETRSYNKRSDKDSGVAVAPLEDPLPEPSLSQLSLTTSGHNETRSGSGFKWFKDRQFVDIKGIQYVLPVDITETDRQDQKYYLYKTVLEGQTYFSPVKERLRRGCKVLDIGCGTGIWLMELAIEFPESKFVGIDIMANYPSIKPANCNFLQVNVTTGIPVADDTFEFIVIRNMETSFTRDQWTQVLNESIRTLQPGGYIELWSLDGNTFRPSPTTKSLVDRILLALLTRGIDGRIGREFKTLLSTTGFDPVDGNFFSMPLGWGGRVGQENIESMVQAYIGAGPLFSVAMNIPIEDYNSLVYEAGKDCGEYKSFWNHYYAYGMKPFPL